MSQLNSTQPKLTMSVNAADIEATLNRLWDSLHTEGRQELGVTRACMSNLLIACLTEEQAIYVRERIPALVERHPARVFLLTAIAPEEGHITAEVSVHCRNVETGQQLYSEYIDIHFVPEIVERLGSVLRPLLIGDLPTALWWASNQPPPLTGHLFDVLAELADQVIYDSTGWPDPVKGVRAMTRWVIGDERPVFNLVWRLLRPWRRMLAQMLAPQVAPDALNNIYELRIKHGPHALPMAWLLVGWLAARLGWQPERGKLRSSTQVNWSFRALEHMVQVQIHRLEEGAAHLQCLEIGWRGQHPGRATFLMDDDLRLSIVPESSTLPQAAISGREPPIEVMISAQLAHRTRDPLFQQALGVAQRMAGALE